MTNLSQFFSLAIMLLIGTVGVGQDRANDLQDIVGEKGSYAEMDLQKRGYVHIKTDKSSYDVYSYWWNQSQRKCVSYHLSDGRVQSIVNTPSFDCNQHSSNGGNNGYSAYNHQSHHHTNQTHYSQQDKDQAYERGHSDALYNKAYHNIYAETELKNAYTEGYNSGVNHRANNTRYHSNTGGYSDYARINDLIGLSVDRTGKELKNRGFTKLDHLNIDGQKRRHRYFYNKNRNQCIETISRNETTLDIVGSSRCNK